MEQLVSIALCTYNGGEFIGQQLDSILNQTHRNLEIIIADDCSTDDTFKIVKRYANKDSRVQCYKNEVNIGFNKNFEYAIKLTTGDYIAICNQDDIWLPQKIERLLNEIGNKWLIFSNLSYIDDQGKVIEGGTSIIFDPAAYNYKSILLANFVTGHTVLFKREFVSYFSPVPLDGFFDWWFGFVAIYHRQITYLGENFTEHRIHDASFMQQRINSGREKQEANKTTYTMLSAFSNYKHLEVKDKIFIEHLRDAYKQNLYRLGSIPLIKIIFKYYRWLFPGFKHRAGFSLLNFAFKYSRKVKNYA